MRGCRDGFYTLFLEKTYFGGGAGHLGNTQSHLFSESCNFSVLVAMETWAQAGRVCYQGQRVGDDDDEADVGMAAEKKAPSPRSYS